MEDLQLLALKRLAAAKHAEQRGVSDGAAADHKPRHLRAAREHGLRRGGGENISVIFNGKGEAAKL